MTRDTLNETPERRPSARPRGADHHLPEQMPRRLLPQLEAPRQHTQSQRVPEPIRIQGRCLGRRLPEREGAMKFSSDRQPGGLRSRRDIDTVLYL